MDVIIFTPSPSYGDKLDIMEWLGIIYNQNLQEIENWLRRLKERGLLEDVDMTTQTIGVHDLYREFAKLESEGKLNASTDFEKRRVYYEDTSPAELETTPSHRCWQNLIRIGILAKLYPSWQHVKGLQGIEWRYCSNVVVLKLVRLDKLQGDLNLEGLKCLRSLEFIEINQLDRLDGLQDMKNLSYFKWRQYSNWDVRTHLGRLLSSLKVLQFLRIGIWLRSDMFACCTNLSKLELECCRAYNLDFRNCTSLQSVTLESLPLRTLSGLNAATVSSLQVQYCYDLVEIPGLHHLVGLQLLHLHANDKLEKLLDLQKLSRLQVLNILSMEIAGLGCLLQLRELTCKYLPHLVIKLPNLSGFEQLQVFDFYGSRELSSLEGVIEDLPALRCLNLCNCESLSRLPDLSRLENLEELDLRGCGIEFGEKDICMLAALPLLRPVRVGEWSFDALRLDVVRRKVLK